MVSPQRLDGAPNRCRRTPDAIGHKARDDPVLERPHPRPVHNREDDQGQGTRTQRGTMTTAMGRWTSLPMAWLIAAGTRPSAASAAVMSTARRRSSQPLVMAMSSGSPTRRRSRIADSTSTPLSDACPIRAMKPPRRPRGNARWPRFGRLEGRAGDVSSGRAAPCRLESLNSWSREADECT